MSEWISVKDRLPENDMGVLVFDTISGLILMCTFWRDTEHGDEIGYFGGYSIANDEGVTHWMPLPEPPEEGKKKKLSNIAFLSKSRNGE